MKKLLPTYSSDEVRVFHPVFNEALLNAIESEGLSNELEVVHHWSAKNFSGIVDFVIQNKKSKKVLLPIEIKKTPFDLRSQGRRQARNYWQELGDFRGSNFYMASNLEYVELFKTSNERKLTLAQLLDTSKRHVGPLANALYEDFIEDLEASLVEALRIVHGNDGTQYASNISGLMHALEYTTGDIESWHQAQSFYMFDYIKGALIRDELLGAKVAEWESSVIKASSPHSLREVISQIDFDVIFDKPIKGRFNEQEIRQIVAGAFDAGLRSDLGQDLNSIVNEIVMEKKNTPGVVETEAPLASLLLHHASQAFKKSLHERPVLLEPGCGSGNLLIAAKNHFPSLRADNIIGVEKEEYFREILGLRVGLGYIESIRQGLKPKLLIQGIENLTPELLQPVNLVVMNPPFIRGIDSKFLKADLGEKTSKISGVATLLGQGQLGFECAFLEHVVTAVPAGTVLATVFPKNALDRPQSKAVRKYFLEVFGLSEIISFQDDGAFRGVQKSTVLLIGTKGKPATKIFVRDYLPLLKDFSISNENLGGSFSDENYRFKEIDAAEFSASLENGWKKFLVSNFSDVNDFMRNLGELSTLESLQGEITIRRGSAGNLGASDLIFGDSVSGIESGEDANAFWRGVPISCLMPAAKNSDNVPREISKDMTQVALNLGEADLELRSVVEMLNNYVVNKSSGKAVTVQRRALVSLQKLKKIFGGTKQTEGCYVLVPRATRVNGQISYSLGQSAIVSTNFVEVLCSSKKKTILLASWLFSVFGQLQMESISINQEGMRKIEVSQIKSILVPFFENIGEEVVEEIEKELLLAEPVNYKNVEIRDIDKVLAKHLFGDSGISLAEHAVSLLRDLSRERLHVG